MRSECDRGRLSQGTMTVEPAAHEAVAVGTAGMHNKSASDGAAFVVGPFELVVGADGAGSAVRRGSEDSSQRTYPMRFTWKAEWGGDNVAVKVSRLSRGGSGHGWRGGGGVGAERGSAHPLTFW